MVIIQLMGGLGNQLQQYAFYRKLKSEKVQVKIDDSWFEESNQEGKLAKRKLELNYLGGIDYERASSREVYSLVGGRGLLGKIRRKLLPFTVKSFEENGRIYVPWLVEGILEKGNIKEIYLQGYFACEKYYVDILPLLREEISFPLDKSSHRAEIVDLADSMINENSIAIHLRRGDYLDPVNMAMFGNIATSDYYDAAVDYLTDKVENPSFYIFSDDKEYALEYAKSLMAKYPLSYIRYVDINHGDESFYDIYLMSKARVNICANSTFSFWGARYNGRYDKIMIRPTIHRNDHKFNYDEMKGLWKDWIFISPEGKVNGQAN